jgi:hypothetical protein
MAWMATARDDFSLLPTALNLDNNVIVAVPHLLLELGLNSKLLKILKETETTKRESIEMIVTEFGPVATTILGLSKLSHQVINNKKLHK